MPMENVEVTRKNRIRRAIIVAWLVCAFIVLSQQLHTSSVILSKVQAIVRAWK